MPVLFIKIIHKIVFDFKIIELLFIFGSKIIVRLNCPGNVVTVIFIFSFGLIVYYVLEKNHFKTLGESFELFYQKAENKIKSLKTISNQCGWNIAQSQG